MYKYAMTIILFVVLLFHGMTATCEDGNLVIRNWENKDDKIKVIDDRSNLYVEKSNSPGNLIGTPEDSSAFRVASRDESIEWQPKWSYSGVGGVRIADTALSQDKTLLALVENIGNEASISGSRILMLNTCNDRIVKVVEIPRRKVNRICFITGTEKIICAAERQTMIKQQVSLFVVDAVSGQIGPLNNTFDEKIRHLAVSRDGSNVFIMMDTSRQIFMLSPDAWNETPKKLKKVEESASIMMVSIGNALLVPSKGELRQYDAVTGQYFDLISLPSDYTPTMIIQKPESKTLILLEDREKAYIINNRRYKKFFDGAGNAGTFAKNPERLFLLNRSGSINTFDIPGYERQKKFIKPSSYKPKTSGNLIKLWDLPPVPEINQPKSVVSKKGKKKKKASSKKRKKKPNPERIMILDSHGNLYYFYKTGRKWRKKLVFTAKK